jgi:hypothetical protein
MSSAAAEVRSDALRHAADEAAVDLAIAQLSTPDHPTYDSVVDIGGRRVSIRHPGRRPRCRLRAWSRRCR